MASSYHLRCEPQKSLKSLSNFSVDFQDFRCRNRARQARYSARVEISEKPENSNQQNLLNFRGSRKLFQISSFRVHTSSIVCSIACETNHRSHLTRSSHTPNRRQLPLRTLFLFLLLRALPVVHEKHDCKNCKCN